MSGKMLGTKKIKSRWRVEVCCFRLSISRDGFPAFFLDDYDEVLDMLCIWMAIILTDFVFVVREDVTLYKLSAQSPVNVPPKFTNCFYL